MADADYNDTHRALLHEFLAKREIRMEDMKPLLASILSAADESNPIDEEDVSDQMVQAYVDQTNNEISNFDFQIRSILDQQDRSKIFALVNTSSDNLIQLATSHSADEIAFFKRILDMMFETNNTPNAEVLAVNSIAAIQLHKNPQGQDTQSQRGNTQPSSGLTMTGAEAALKAFVDEGWLVRSQAGFYSLSPRALLELNFYLIQSYNAPADESSDHELNPGIERIKFCYACKEIVTVGKRCSNNSCNFRLHDPCATQYFRTQRTMECPTCNAEWTGENHVGEKAFPQLESAAAEQRRLSAAGNRGRRPTHKSQRGKQKQQRMEDEEHEQDGDEDGDEDRDEEEEVNETRTRYRY